MSVTRLAHNKFHIRIYVRRHPLTKKRVNQVTTFYGTEEQALRLEKRMKAKVKTKKFSSPSRMKLNDLLDLYLEDAQARMAPRTFNVMKKAFGRWVRPKIGQVSLKGLTPHLLQSYFRHLSAPKETT